MAIIGDAYIAVHAITTGFESDIQDAINRLRPQLQDFGTDLGDQFASAFSKGFRKRNMFGDIGAEADQAKAVFNSLTRTGYRVVPVIAGVASAIGDVVMGLGALVSAVGRAAPALAVAASGFSALAQAGITAKLAFGGIGKAVQAFSNPAGGGNQKAVEDARRRLAQTYQRTAETMAAANDKVRKAQIALNAAYEKGAESLQQLGFDAEEAALSQDKAAIALERARETLMRSQDLAPESRDRREAELAFKEAELNYRKVTDQANDLRKQQEYAAQTGIEGTKEVIDATNALREAEADRVKQTRDNAQDIAEAQRAVADAMSSSAGAMAQALKGLSPEAKKFAKYLAGLKPIMQDLKGAAGKELFGPLQRAIQTLVDKFVPVLIPILQKTGKAIGAFAESFAKMLSSPEVIAIFNRVFGESNIKLIGMFGTVFGNLVVAFFKLLDAARPLAEEFGKFLVNISGSAAASKGLDKTLGRAGEAAKIIGKSLGSMFRGLKMFFSLGADAGLEIFKAFGRAGEGLQKFTKENAPEIKDKFDQIAKNIIAMGRVLGTVLKLFYDLSGSKGVETFAKKMEVIAPMFSDIGTAVVDEMAGPFADFIVNLAKLTRLFLETGGMKLFFDILNKAMEIAIKMFSDKNIQKIMLFLAAFKGVSLALGTIGTVAKFFSLATVFGHFKSLFEGIMTVVGGFSRFRAVWFPLIRQFAASLLGIGSLGTGPFLAIVAAIAAVIFILFKAYQESEKLRDAIGHLLDTVGKAFSRAWKDVQKALEEVMPYFEDASDLFKTIGDFIAEHIVPILETVLYGAIRTVGGVIAGLIRIAGGLFKVFLAIYNVVEMLVKAIGGDFSGALEKGKEAFNNFTEGMGSIVKGVLSPISWIWEENSDNSQAKKNAQAGWMKSIDTKGQFGSGGAQIIQQSQQNYADIISGKKTTPKGFSTSYAGVLGTPTPAASPTTINVYPSAGMDERALAASVSREVAWAARTGRGT